MTNLQASVTLTWSDIAILQTLLDQAVKAGRFKDCEALAATLEGAKLRAIENLVKS